MTLNISLFNSSMFLEILTFGYSLKKKKLRNLE